MKSCKNCVWIISKGTTYACTAYANEIVLNEKTYFLQVWEHKMCEYYQSEKKK